MRVKYFTANPAGNITAFVHGDFQPSEKVTISNYLMNTADKSIEQVAFIKPDNEFNWHMDMMGGEFCGNASRSFGLWQAIQNKEKGQGSIYVSVSGTDKPVKVKYDVEESIANVKLNPAQKITYHKLKGIELCLVTLEGISHIIIEGHPEDQGLAEDLINKLMEVEANDAYGVMFLNDNEMVPYVYVPATNSLVRESSCGSGSVAVGYYLNQEKNPEFKQVIKQAGGDIEVIYSDGQYSISSKITFGPIKKITI